MKLLLISFPAYLASYNLTATAPTVFNAGCRDHRLTDIVVNGSWLHRMQP